jgi:hypothetical protein
MAVIVITWLDDIVILICGIQWGETKWHGTDRHASSHSPHMLMSSTSIKVHLHAGFLTQLSGLTSTKKKKKWIFYLIKPKSRLKKTGCKCTLMQSNVGTFGYPKGVITLLGKLAYWKMLLRHCRTANSAYHHCISYRCFRSKTSYRSSASMLNPICESSGTRYYRGSTDLLAFKTQPKFKTSLASSSNYNAPGGNNIN